MKNERKLLKIKKFLDENGIRYKERSRHRHGHSDIYVIDTRVCIKVEGKDDDYFFRRHKKYAHPVFVRRIDTPSFVVEKVANTIRDAMIAQQKGIVRKQQTARNRKNATKQKTDTKNKAGAFVADKRCRKSGNKEL